MTTKVERYFANQITNGWAELLLFFTEEDFLKITGRLNHILPAGSYMVIKMNKEGMKTAESMVDVRLHRAIHLIIDNCNVFPSRAQSGILSPSLYRKAMERMAKDNICEKPMRGKKGKWIAPPDERQAYKEQF